MWCLNRVEISANYCRPKRVSFGHSHFKFLQPPCGLCENEVEIENAHRCSIDCDVSVQAPAISNHGESKRSHKTNKYAGSERQKMPVFRKLNFPLTNNRMFRKRHDEIIFHPVGEQSFNVRAVCD